jgi:hypothetical protein
VQFAQGSGLVWLCAWTPRLSGSQRPASAAGREERKGGGGGGIGAASATPSRVGGGCARARACLPVCVWELGTCGGSGGSGERGAPGGHLDALGTGHVFLPVDRALGGLAGVAMTSILVIDASGLGARYCVFGNE